MVESESQVTDSDQLETSSEASPVKILPPPPEPDEKVSPPKPRKLIALQYNYSDSEDDETREERKARVVSFQYTYCVGLNACFYIDHINLTTVNQEIELIM